MRRFGTQKGKSQVYLNVYDLHESNDFLYPLGFGSFHSGVQIGQTEYTFGGGSGVFTHEAKNVPNAKLRDSILLGEFEGSSRDIDSVVDELRPSFPGTSYNILTKNCNHFSDSFSVKLLNRHIPEYVNRMANLGSYLSCLLPPSMTGQAPVDADGSSRVEGFTVSGGKKVAASKMESRSFVGSSGVKLGQSDASGTDAERVPLMDELDRRERMREAALRRFNNAASDN